jgi:TetR/AcrR family transcriptional regulator
MPAHPESETPRARERRDPDATRNALLAAGAALFSEPGYDAVSIEQLAARAGVNKALISYHFGGKRGLYSAVLASGFQEIAQRLEAAEQAAADAPEALHALLEVFAAFRAEHPEFPGLFIREVLSSGVDPAVVPHLVSIIGIVRRIVVRGTREGAMRPVNPMLVHFGLVGAIVFFTATEPARRRAAAERRLPFAMPELPEFLRYLEQLTLRGLAPGTPEPARSAGGRRPGARRGHSPRSNRKPKGARP